MYTLSNYLPSLQRPPFPGGVRSLFSCSFEDLTFLTMTDKLVLGYILWHTLWHSRQLHDFAWQSYIVCDNSAWCVTFDRCITGSMHSHLLRGVAQRASRIVKTCTLLMEITKEGAQSLRIKMKTAELYLKEATVIYGFYLLTARLPELTWKL